MGSKKEWWIGVWIILCNVMVALVRQELQANAFLIPRKCLVITLWGFEWNQTHFTRALTCCERGVLWKWLWWKRGWRMASSVYMFSLWSVPCRIAPLPCSVLIGTPPTPSLVHHLQWIPTGYVVKTMFYLLVQLFYHHLFSLQSLHFLWARLWIAMNFIWSANYVTC